MNRLLSFNLRVLFNKQLVGLNKPRTRNNVVAISDTAGSYETFQIVRKDDDPNRVRSRAPNGFFLRDQYWSTYITEEDFMFM
uniref:DUF7910 domain-containing protein n=1 Tax=Nelumbo nucifera TaxID=4432 RepID=A0A822Z6S6_NELNU|nr:TPA_asm: hypothetical protein HUJ06_014606 [Nelumbo nucifera]